MGKGTSSLTLSGCDASNPVYVVMRSVTLPCFYNQSTVTSLASPESSALPLARDKSGANGSSIETDALVVSAIFPDCYYVESGDRSWGIRVAGTVAGPGKVRIIGTLRTNAAGERYIEATNVTSAGSGSITPVYVPNKALGGGDWRYDPANGSGQRGVMGVVGLNNIGMLVRTCGKVTVAGRGWFYMDDGSRVSDGSGLTGVYVDTQGKTAPAKGSIVAVTGISGCDSYLGQLVSTLRAVDIQVLTQALLTDAGPARAAANPRVP